MNERLKGMLAGVGIAAIIIYIVTVIFGSYPHV